MEEGDSQDINFKDVEHKVKKIFKKSQKKTKTKGTQAKAILSGSPDDEVYSLEYKTMGKCLIFSHKEYDRGLRLDERPDTAKDADALKTFFEGLKFDVKVYNDREKQEIQDILIEAGNEDHTDAYGFVCCVMSHGDCKKKDKQEVIYAKNAYYSTEDLFSPFENCISLAGKPKIFFIQACRGEELDSGNTIYYNMWNFFIGNNIFTSAKCSMFEETSDSIVTEPLLCCKIPKKADFLIAYSTPKNCLSWKRDGMGSWFIQTLCATLNQRVQDLDLLSILTIVNKRVAYDYESVVSDKKRRNKKQVPSVYSTLTKRIQFSISTCLSVCGSDFEESFEENHG